MYHRDADVIFLQDSYENLKCTSFTGKLHLDFDFFKGWYDRINDGIKEYLFGYNEFRNDGIDGKMGKLWLVITRNKASYIALFIQCICHADHLTMLIVPASKHIVHVPYSPTALYYTWPESKFLVHSGIKPQFNARFCLTQSPQQILLPITYQLALISHEFHPRRYPPPSTKLHSAPSTVI